MALVTLIVTVAGFGLLIGLQAFTMTQVANFQSGPTLSTDLFGTPTGDVDLAISGSTTCYPAITAHADTYMTYHSNYDIRVSGGGSGQGADDVYSGIVDVGMMSRPMKSAEHSDMIDKYGSYNDVRFALDGVTIIVDKSSFDAGSTTMSWMTLDALHMIYSGAIAEWDDLAALGPGYSDINNAPNQDIAEITREEGSGTRETFEDYTLYYGGGTSGQKLSSNSSYNSAVGGYATADGNPAMKETVGSTDYSIGYVGLAFYSSAVHYKIDIKPWNTTTTSWEDPVEATAETIANFTYPISRFLHLMVPGSTIPTNVRAFIDFVLGVDPLVGDLGQSIVESVGYIKIFDDGYDTRTATDESKKGGIILRTSGTGP